MGVFINNDNRNTPCKICNSKKEPTLKVIIDFGYVCTMCYDEKGSQYFKDYQLAMKEL